MVPGALRTRASGQGVPWERAPMPATEVAEQVIPEKDWSLQAVKTLLSGWLPKRWSAPSATVVVFSILRWSNGMIISPAYHEILWIGFSGEKSRRWLRIWPKPMN